MTTYYYILASQRFLVEEEPLDEVFSKRTLNSQEINKKIDFWLIKQPDFIEALEFTEIITWLKLCLEFVIKGEFEVSSISIADPLAFLEGV